MPKKIACLCALLVFTIVATSAANQPVISFSAPSYTFAEAEPHSYVHVVCACDASATVTFQLKFVDIRSYDTFVFSGMFADGVTDLPFDLGSFYDGIYDPGRGYTVTLQNVTGAVIGTPGTASIAIIEDDAPPQVSINDITVAQDTTSDVQAIFTLSLSVALPRSCFIEVRVVDGSARNGVDFNSTPDAVAYFPARTAFAQCAIDIAPERAPEGDETFSAVIDYMSDPVITIGKGVGTCTIQGNGAVTPDFQRIPKGGKGLISIQLTDPAVSPEQIVLQSSSSFLTFPAAVTLAAGASSADIEIGATDIGDGEIDVTLPPSRGGRTFACRVSVYDPVAFNIDPPTVQVPVGTTVTLTAKMDPAPSSPMTIPLAQSSPNLADIPQNIVIDAKGSTTFPVRGVAPGATFLTATLPEANGAATANVLVTVTVPTGLTITGVTPQSGRASGADAAMVNGYNMNGPCVVEFGGTPAMSESTVTNGIDVSTPPHAPGVVDVTVRCGKASVVDPGAFTYVPAPLAIAKIDPAVGTTRGGTIVTINATNFPEGQCTATFGGAVAHAFVWSDSSMAVTTPPHAAGIVPVTLTCGSDRVTLASGFTYAEGDDPPAVPAGLNERSGAPGDFVDLFADHVRLDDRVVFGTATAAPAPSQPPTFGHYVLVPELPAGVVPLSLIDSAGRTTFFASFEILPPTTPLIADIHGELTAGEEFVVLGSGFRPALTFSLGSAILMPVTIESQRALFRVPANTPIGTATFTIADHGTIADSRSIDVTSSGIAVTAVSPECAPRAGTQLVTISGSGFADGAMVQFGSTFSANVSFASASKLVAEAPPAYSEDDVVITVTNPDGAAATLTNVFAYRSEAEGGCISKHHAVGR